MIFVRTRFICPIVVNTVFRHRPSPFPTTVFNHCSPLPIPTTSLHVLRQDGALCHGMFLQGASWDLQGVCLERSKPKEMFVVMPVVLCKSVFTDKVETNGVWYCPVYKTEMRGPTYVFEAQLKSKSPGSRWVLAGVAMILDIV